MNRHIESELLDSLSHDDPRALRNRRDIRFLNGLMGNFRWIARELGRISHGSGIFEIGAGDGSLGLYLLRRGIIDRNTPYCGVDRIPRPDTWPESWSWQQADLLESQPDSRHGILLANLILHQFRASELKRIGSFIQKSSLRQVIICEPRRHWLHLWQNELTRLFGMGRITLHDARISIRAGFRNSEVFHALGMDKKTWDLRSSGTILGANRVVCFRK